jgi:hypothetical protein
MNAALGRALVLNEWRLRSRRTSTLVIGLAVVALSWFMVIDPSSGMAMMVASRQRIAYESQALAFGTGLMMALLFGLAGFYLARGRSQLDLRTGTAAVLAATPVSNAQLLGVRWLGAFGFLMSLGLVVMLTLWVLQLVRGEGPLQPLPYLQMLVFGLAPGLMLCASLAVLCDAWAPLMGKRGDLLYWGFWVAQFAFLPVMLQDGVRPQLNGWQVFDIQGASALLVGLSRLMDVKHVSVGGGAFDASLPLLHMPAGLWSPELVALRVGSMGLALLPLVPAVLRFHRYAPDRVKARPASHRGAFVRALQWLLRPLLWPLGRALGLLLRASAHVPGVTGRVLAEVALVLLSQPLLAGALFASMVAGAFVPTAQLPAVLAVGLAAWGLAVADVSSRDLQSGTLALASAVPGGAAERLWRQALAAWGLGLLVAAPALLRWATEAPLRVAACLAGLALLGAAATVLGRLTEGSRTFLGLFLFGLYVNLQQTGLAALDLLGLSGAATPGSVAGYAVAAGGAVMALGWVSRRAPA